MVKIDPKILAQYKPALTEIVYNEEDKDLATIIVPLPKCPPLEEVIGYGLPAKDQYYRYEKMPQKIIDLQNIQPNGQYLTVDEIWDILNREQSFYENEIRFIRNMWQRRLYGVWMFIDGTPTYIDGWHDFYCQSWRLPEGLPEYRDRDMRWFHFQRFCYNDPCCYGSVGPKHRREGASSRAQCVLFCIISLLEEAHSGTQSKTDEDARRVFQNHLVTPFKRLPFYYRPVVNSDDPMNKLVFRPPSSKGLKGLKRNKRNALYSSMGFEASGEQAYDGAKLHAFHHDEIGKAHNVDINLRWDVVKPCLAQGGGGSIHGFSLHTSTAGSMSKGGADFKAFCEDSNYAEKNENGQTGTGLYTMFMPCYHGLDGYVDKYGQSVIETPTPEQKEYLMTHKRAGKVVCPNPNIGAKEFIQNTIDYWKKKKNYKKLNEFMRQHPTSFRGCFIADAAQSFFDLVKINERLDQLHDDKAATVPGYFEWVGKRYGGQVRFVPDPENPKFELSKQLTGYEVNRVTYNATLETWEALNAHKYCAGGDPFKANDTKAKKNSLGGGAVFEGHNISKDPYEKPYEEWESCRFVCTYLHRPADKEEYSEDMIMMCVYFGCPMNPETNVPDLREAFIKNGYRGMLVHNWNIETEKMDEIAGQATSTKTKQVIFKLYQHYVNRHIHKERHKKLIEQIRDTVGVEDMTDNDLFTAGGYAMLGFEQYGIEMQEDMKGGESATQDLTDFIPEFSY